ncbi:MAG TPA: hypothetical protein VHN15_12785 [Thermoanaerobaculia bacterium]|nr:hypothetical protein [Thermoanaerobaculia bacterium]
MTNVGITGHQKLPDPDAWPWVESALRTVLSNIERPWLAVSSLAQGADQVFARIAIEQGADLYAVVPFPEYEETFPDGESQALYRELLRQASSVEILERLASDEESYLRAGQRMVDLSNLVVAVWNGKKAAGLGGTGDIVEYARSQGKAVFHIDPMGRPSQ